MYSTFLTMNVNHYRCLLKSTTNESLPQSLLAYSSRFLFPVKKKKNQCERMTHVTKIKVTDSDRTQKVVLENIIKVTLANPSALYIVECH